MMRLYLLKKNAQKVKIKKGKKYTAFWSIINNIYKYTTQFIRKYPCFQIDSEPYPSPQHGPGSCSLDVTFSTHPFDCHIHSKKQNKINK